MLSASSAATTPATAIAAKAFRTQIPQLHTIRTRTDHCFGPQQFSKTSYRLIVHPVKAMAETVATPQSAPKLSTSGRKQALISLSDKTDLAKLGNGLQELGYTIVSTGGTASALEGAGVSVTKVEELTRFPEMLDGRVKTLHPGIHGGILARRDQEHHMEALEKHEIGTFDVVVVNLYPFYAKVSSSSGISFEDGIENIDIGGPAMIRAAAKNHRDVLVVVDSEDYPDLLEFLRGDNDDQQFRRKLAWKAFQHVASYDSAVSEWLWKQTIGDKFPPSLTVPLSLKDQLRCRDTGGVFHAVPKEANNTYFLLIKGGRCTELTSITPLNLYFEIPTPMADSVFAHVVRAPEDPILGVTVAYNNDSSPVKVNLGVGAYRTEEGKPLVLNVVRRAEQMLVNDTSRVKEYLSITGIADFNKLSAKLIFGADSPAIKENRVTTVQCLSGTGSLRVGAEFLARHYHEHTIYIPQPTWGNHPKIFTLAGLSVKYYRYYDPATRGLDFQGLLDDLTAAPVGAIVLLHACAHNPTGVDPTIDQWEKIRQLMRSKGLLPFFDSAYQGFASGKLDADAQSVRMFVADGGECLAAQSYAKNMGLYGERVGALSIVCKDSDVASKVESQLKMVIRPMYSNPPIHGASIVATILKDRQMYDEWTVELKAMADRIISMRQQLYAAMQARGTPGDWSHIIKQIGMFTFTGLNAEQVSFMTSEYHIYMTSDGRISMAGLSSRTVPHLADAMHAAITRAA